MHPVIVVFLVILAAVEIFYWLWWLPRNWRQTREAKDIEAWRTLYGKRGIVWRSMRRGQL